MRIAASYSGLKEGFFERLADLVSERSGVSVQAQIIVCGDQMLVCTENFEKYEPALNAADKIIKTVAMYLGIAGDIRINDDDNEFGTWRTRNDVILGQEQEIANLRHKIWKSHAGSEDDDLPF